MPLESGSYISDLVASNPVGSTDPKSQGDDHLRLIKSVLQTTFPTASRAFRFESISSTKSANYSVVSSDDRALIRMSASGASRTVNLPSTSSVGTGFTVSIIKTDRTSNAVTIDGNGSETINGETTIKLENWQDSVTLWTNGSNWWAVYHNSKNVRVLEKSSNYTMGLQDNGKVIACNSGITVSLDAAGTLEAGWHCDVVSVSGTTTINPNGSQTINGETTLTLEEGSFARIFCNGSKFYASTRFATGKGADIASAGTMTLGQDGDYFDVTGSTTINGINAWRNGHMFTLHFDSALTLKHDVTNFSLVGDADVDVEAKDEVIFVERSSGKFRMVSWQKHSGKAYELPAFENRYFECGYEKAAGADGGTATSGSWQTYALSSTYDNNISGASRSGNTITLPAGTYRFEGQAVFGLVGNVKLRLRNNTGSSNIFYGLAARSAGSDSDYILSRIQGVFTISATKTLEIQYRVDATVSSNGRGRASGWGDEVYGKFVFWKLDT